MLYRLQKLYETDGRHEHSSQKSLVCLAEETCIKFEVFSVSDKEYECEHFTETQGMPA
jgi:hypothetical protein